MEPPLVPDVFQEAVLQSLRQGSIVFGRIDPNYRPRTPTAQQRAKTQWMAQREREAFALAPWLKDQLEAEW